MLLIHNFVGVVANMRVARFTPNENPGYTTARPSGMDRTPYGARGLTEHTRTIRIDRTHLRAQNIGKNARDHLKGARECTERTLGAAWRTGKDRTYPNKPQARGNGPNARERTFRSPGRTGMTETNLTRAGMDLAQTNKRATTNRARGNGPNAHQTNRRSPRFTGTK